MDTIYKELWIRIGQYWLGAGNVRDMRECAWEEHCQLVRDTRQRNDNVKIIGNLERRSGSIEGRKVRVTRKEFRRLKEEFNDSSFMAQRGMCHLVERRIKDARRGEVEGSLNFCGNAKPWWNRIRGLDSIRFRSGFEKPTKEIAKPRKGLEGCLSILMKKGIKLSSILMLSKESSKGKSISAIPRLKETKCFR